VDPVPDSLLLRKSGSAVNRTGTSGSVARNSGHQTTEAVLLNVHYLVEIVYITWHTHTLISYCHVHECDYTRILD
jgi:hypothetical protein